MASHKVGVFPASGGIGGSTVKYLLPRLPAKDLVFIARNPANLESARAAGATIRQGNYDDDNTLQHVFQEIDTLFLISYASVEYEHRAERHRTAIDFALRSGVKYIFYGSLGFVGQETSKESVAHVMRAHLDTEKYLDECTRTHPGFAYTVIREGLYSESYPLYTAFFNPQQPVDEIRIPHDGSGPGIAWVKREELGEGTAELLSRFVSDPADFRYRLQTVLLSGSKTLTLRETVDILGKIAERPIHIRQVSDGEFAAQPQMAPNFTYHGVDHSTLWATAFEAFRKGEAATVSPLLRELLGREPEDFETTIARSV
ncbi:nmrA-like family protein [Sclerotinia borealis F-4128]|uniref:NmrA-like family protein n=1 Tax=Sclerotinia borealis (strain F-4128) TaxID=1432307 RepID=W9CKG4_SCLBF|nr:nmrA-like family protein [Sclerotinia borealis F-4128]